MLQYCIIMAMILPGINCLLGYDCGGTSFNVSSISLLDVGQCQDVGEEPNSTTTYIQLLQVADYTDIKVHTCRVEVDRQIYHCGMHSHVSLVHGSHRRYLVDMDHSACERLHKTRTFLYGRGSVVADLLPNTTNYRSLQLAGSNYNDGTCHGAQFSDSYGSWNNVVVQATLYITFWDYQATVKTAQDSLLLRSGTRCRASELACMDDDGSNVYWSPLPDDMCEFHAYDVLYQGYANKTTDLSSRYPTVYSLTSDAQVTFALSRKSERYVCGYTLIQTEHPKLLIVETSRDNPFAKQSRILVENLDTFVYFNSKLVYVEKHIKGQLETLYRNVITQKCILERQVLTNAITNALNQPDMFAYYIMKGPGHIGVIAGEVAHIVKCIPVDVKRRSTTECYTELPVTFNNQSMFLTPKTRILQKTGTPVDCNPLLPIMYQVKGGWMTLTPRPAAAFPPEVLKPLMQPTWKYIDAEHLAENGIYSTDDLDRLREHIMFPIERPGLVTNFAKAAAGHRVPASGISLSHLLDEKTLDYITESASAKFFNGITKFGTYTSTVIGLWMIAKIVKMLADTLIHGYALHSIYGWSIHLLGAIFSSITNLMLHLGRSVVTPAPTDTQPPVEPPTEPLVESSTSNRPPPVAVTIETPDPATPVTAPPTSTSTLPAQVPPNIYPHIKPDLNTLNNSITSIEQRINDLKPSSK